MGTVKHSHTTQPGQPPYYQSGSSSNTEKASTQPVQLPQTYTTVVYQCYPLVVMQTLWQLDSIMSFHWHHMHAKTAGFTHTDRAATMHLLRP